MCVAVGGAKCLVAPLPASLNIPGCTSYQASTGSARSYVARCDCACVVMGCASQANNQWKLDVEIHADPSKTSFYCALKASKSFSP